MRNSRRGQVDPFIVMDVMEAARARRSGWPTHHSHGGGPARNACAARARERRWRARWQQDPMGYTVALGLPALRARIARLYGEWYDLELDPGAGDRDAGIVGGVHSGVHGAV